MSFEKEIVNFISEQIGGITILEQKSGDIVYADGFFQKRYGASVVGKKGGMVYRWLADCPLHTVKEEMVEWEYIDTEIKRYYKFNSAYFEKENAYYQIHALTDITEYMSLNRDVMKYMSFFKRLSGFQTAVLEKLSATFYELVPMLTEYFKTDGAYFFIQREEQIDVVSCKHSEKDYQNDRIPYDERVGLLFGNVSGKKYGYDSFGLEIQEIFKENGEDEHSRYCLLCNGEVSGQQYALYLLVGKRLDEESLKEKTLLSVIRLYIENGLMQEQLRYESEHDRMTGLYNKGKYMERLQSEYQHLDSIGVFNFDVNNLKMMNDHYGHEAGDKLLIKAADSIRKVTNDHVHGYRIGGDEYMMIACNVTEQEVALLKQRWEKELEHLNTMEDGIHCVMAVGVVYGEKGYDFAELSNRADTLMYEDKKRKKRPGEVLR